MYGIIKNSKENPNIEELKKQIKSCADNVLKKSKIRF